VKESNEHYIGFTSLLLLLLLLLSLFFIFFFFYLLYYRTRFHALSHEAYVREVLRYHKIHKLSEKEGKCMRQGNLIPHSEPVTYLFCKNAFCTNNKIAVR
jgi:hypothetical protein